jgi:hypothetical protein
MQRFIKISTEIPAEFPPYREISSYQQTTYFTSFNHYPITTQSSMSQFQNPTSMQS